MFQYAVLILKEMLCLNQFFFCNVGQITKKRRTRAFDFCKNGK